VLQLRAGDLTPGDRFVRCDAEWTSVDLLIVQTNLDADVLVQAMPRNGRAHFESLSLAKNVLVFRNPFPSLNDPEGSREAILVRRASHHWCFTQKQQRGRLSELLDYLSDFFPKPERSLIENCVRYTVAQGSIIVTSRGRAKTLWVKASASALETERAAYYESSFADDIEIQAGRLESLIRHWPTVGSFREELLRNLLQKNLPERYHVATGFVLGNPRQLDILIYDRIDTAPSFREGDLVVVPEAAVRAIIEVKSTLNDKELKSALEIFHDVSPLEQLSAPIFMGLFAYRSSISRDAILEKIVQFYNSSDISYSLGTIWEMFTSICVIKHSLIVSDINKLAGPKGIIVPSIFTIENVLGRTSHAANFINLLKLYLREPNSEAPLDTRAWLLDVELERQNQRNIYDEQWGPYFIDPDFADGDIPDIRQEALALRRWRSGQPWSSG